MSIAVKPVPQELEWKHFVGVPSVCDPFKHTPVPAYTTFDYRMPACKPCECEGGYSFADSTVIEIVPKARIKMGTARTPKLLAHERFRYDVGIVTGRALVRKLSRIRVDNPDELRTALAQACQLHLKRRASAIWERYDRDTQHGKSPIRQRDWLRLMERCLADDEAEYLGELEL